MTTEDTRDLIATTAETARIGRITMLAWRDLDDPEAGGSEVFADRVATAWAEAGIGVTTRTSAAPGFPFDDVRHGYRVVRRSGRHTVFPAAIRDQLTGRLGPADAVVEVWNGIPWLTPLWCRVPRVAFIHHVHVDMWEMSMGPMLAIAGRTIERRAAMLYRSTSVLTPSHGSRQHIIDYLRLPPGNVQVVPPGIDPDFRPGGSRSPRPTVLAVGRLVPHKRVEDLLALMPELLQRVPNARLVVVGEGYHRATLEALARDLGLEDVVEFRRAVSRDELVAAYQEAWVVTSASIAEGWGMTITEAAACGTPAVVSRVGGHVDAVVDGVTGLLADNPDELGRHLAEVLTDGAMRQRLGTGALERAGTLTWGSTAQAILSALADDGQRRRT